MIGLSEKDEQNDAPSPSTFGETNVAVSKDDCTSVSPPFSGHNVMVETRVRPERCRKTRHDLRPPIQFWRDDERPVERRKQYCLATPQKVCGGRIRLCQRRMNRCPPPAHRSQAINLGDGGHIQTFSLWRDECRSVERRSDECLATPRRSSIAKP